jgi:hypothetical protein
MTKDQKRLFDKWYDNQKDQAYLKGERKWICADKRQLIRLINRILKMENKEDSMITREIHNELFKNPYITHIK